MQKLLSADYKLENIHYANARNHNPDHNF